MAKSSKGQSFPKQVKPADTGELGEKFHDMNLMEMSPEKCQEMCQPTDAVPVRMHAKMAGC